MFDVASHRQDMPLTLDGPQRLGLGLWNSVWATLAVEGALFAAGVALYARTTRPLDLGLLDRPPPRTAVASAQ